MSRDIFQKCGVYNKYLLVFFMVGLFGICEMFASSGFKAYKSSPHHLGFIDLKKTLPDSIPLAHDPDSLSLEFMESHIQMIQSDLLNIEAQIQALRKKYTELSSLIPQEQILFSRVESLENLFINRDARSDFNQFHEDLSEAILTFSEKRLKRYQSLSLEKKKQEVQNYIYCYEKLLDVYKSYVDLENEMEFLEGAFTRKVLNPYTMTDMDERQKRIIYDRFIQTLFPYLLKDVKQHISCENVESKMDNFQIVKEKFLQLRDEDTDVLEEKMREETDPERLLDLLDLNLELK